MRGARLPSVFGGGLLERARSTTFALLGLTAALGLSIVALALQQEWPTVADRPIPGIPRQAVGDASVVATATAQTAGGVLLDPAGGSNVFTGRSDRPDATSPVASQPVSTQIAVADSTPSTLAGAPAAPPPVASPTPSPAAQPVAASPAASSAPASQPATAPTAAAPDSQGPVLSAIGGGDDEDHGKPGHSGRPLPPLPPPPPSPPLTIPPIPPQSPAPDLPSWENGHGHGHHGWEDWRD